MLLFLGNCSSGPVAPIWHIKRQTKKNAFSYEQKDEIMEDDKNPQIITQPSFTVITSANMLKTNFQNVKHNRGYIQRVKLSICRKRLIKQCDHSFKDKELPLIPIIMDQNVEKWPDYLG